MVCLFANSHSTAACNWFAALCPLLQYPISCCHGPGEKEGSVTVKNNIKSWLSLAPFLIQREHYRFFQSKVQIMHYQGALKDHIVPFDSFITCWWCRLEVGNWLYISGEKRRYRYKLFIYCGCCSTDILLIGHILSCRRTPSVASLDNYKGLRLQGLKNIQWETLRKFFRSKTNTKIVGTMTSPTIRRHLYSQDSTSARAEVFFSVNPFL